MVLKTPLHPGGVALLGLTAIPPEAVPVGRQAGGRPDAEARRTSQGVVWRDFKPGGGTPARSSRWSSGCPA